MDESQKVVRTAILAVLVILIGFGAYYFLIRTKGEKAPSIERPAAQLPLAPSEKPGVEEEKAPLRLPPVDLNKSDDLLRQLVQELSSDPRLAAWIKGENLIRKFVAAVDAVANGQSPRAQVDFFSPQGKFNVVKRGGKFLIDPQSHDRYNLVSDVFISLNTKSCLRLFRGLKPLFQDAYKELGYPTEDFQDTLIRAIDELLRTPLVEGPIEVEKQVVSYKMVDEELESLNPAQKHFLRMGPENLQVIQTKLREIALAFGIPKEQLPPSRTYFPKSH